VGAARLAHLINQLFNRKLYYLQNADLELRRYDTHQHVIFLASSVTIPAFISNTLQRILFPLPWGSFAA
jgi:hypothetical protein